MTTGQYNNANPNYNFGNIDWAMVDVSTSFESKKTARLYEWWLSFSPALPLRSSFDIIDHLQDASNIFLYESIAHDNFEYRVNGEEVRRILGLNLFHGHKVKDVQDENHIALIKYLCQVRDSKKCHKCTGDILLSRTRYGRFESIDCPLIGEDGKVQFIVGIIEQLQN